MNLYRDLDGLPDPLPPRRGGDRQFRRRPPGHARIVERLVAMGRQLGAPAVVLTFDPHPARLLRPAQAPAPLCWTERKAALAGRVGRRGGRGLSRPTLAFLHRRPGSSSTGSCSGGWRPGAWSRAATSSSATIAGGTVEVLRQFCAEAGDAAGGGRAVEIGGQHRLQFAGPPADRRRARSRRPGGS